MVASQIEDKSEVPLPLVSNFDGLATELHNMTYQVLEEGRVNYNEAQIQKLSDLSTLTEYMAPKRGSDEPRSIKTVSKGECFIRQIRGIRTGLWLRKPFSLSVSPS